MGGRGASGAGKHTPTGKISVTVEIGGEMKKYPVKLPDSQQHTQIVKPQVLTGKVFAGKGTGIELKNRFKLESDYGISASEWQKVSGKGYVILNGKIVKAELHWYQAKDKAVGIKIKRYLDES